MELCTWHDYKSITGIIKKEISNLSQCLAEIQTFEILNAIRTRKKIIIIFTIFIITNLRNVTSLNKFDTTSTNC